MFLAFAGLFVDVCFKVCVVVVIVLACFCFEGGGSLKPFLVRAKFPWEKQADGKSCGSQEKHCAVCTFLEEDNIFTNKEGGDKYKIREGLHFD